MLNVKSVIEVTEEQIPKTTMCFVVRASGGTIMLLSDPETTVLEVFLKWIH